jgi:hypothetical protein
VKRQRRGLYCARQRRVNGWQLERWTPADRPVVRIWHPDDPKAYVEIQFETQAAADAAVEQWNGILKGATGIEFGKMPSHDRTRQERVRRRDEIPD